jgi:hypothetical protein
MKRRWRSRSSADLTRRRDALRERIELAKLPDDAGPSPTHRRSRAVIWLR